MGIMIKTIDKYKRC